MSDRLTVSDLGTILSVWAHPDDEGYSCGGIMAAAVRAGQRVVCVTATRGEVGSTDESQWPNGPELAAVRTQELQDSLDVLGVSEHEWLDYPDGGCDAVDATVAAGRIAAIIERVRPDTLLTFGPDGGTYHPDHMAVSRWCTEATLGSAIRVLHATQTPEWLATVSTYIPPEMVMMADREPVTFTADECSLYVRLSGADLEQKAAAMLEQRSQVGRMIAMAGRDGFAALLAEEAFTDQRA